MSRRLVNVARPHVVSVSTTVALTDNEMLAFKQMVIMPSAFFGRQDIIAALVAGELRKRTAARAAVSHYGICPHCLAEKYLPNYRDGQTITCDECCEDIHVFASVKAAA